MSDQPDIRPHPQGGWTIAVPYPGSHARIFQGCFRRKRTARRVLGTLRKNRVHQEHWATVERGQR